MSIADSPQLAITTTDARAGCEEAARNNAGVHSRYLRTHAIVIQFYEA